MKLILAALFILAVSMTCEGRPSTTNVACNEAADILFIVDTSSSIWPGHYKNIRVFLKDVISSFNVGPGPLDSRVAVLTFSSREYLEFHLNKYQTVEDLHKAVDRIKFRGGDTYTHRALEFASTVMLTQQHGAREGVSKLVVVLTDGKSVNYKKTTLAAAVLKANGTDVFAVGVGEGVDFAELETIASAPSQQYVYKVTDYKALDSIKSAFTQTTCEVLTSTIAPSTIKTSTTTTTTTTTPTTTTTTPTTTTTTPTTTTTTPTTTTTTPTTTTTTPTTTTTTPTTTTTTPTTTTTTPTTTTTTPTTTTTTTTTTPTTTTTTPTTTTLAPTTPRATTRKSSPRKTTPDQLPQDEPSFDKGCQGKAADIYILLDASTSVWIGHFHDQVLPFVRDLVSSFEISPLLTRIGLVTFSDKVNHEFDLDDHDNLKSLLAALQPEHVDYLTGGTNTGDAIDYVRRKGFAPGESRSGVTRSIVVITDGLSQLPKKTAQAAAQAREEDILIFAVGVGLEVDMKELTDIASDPDEDFVLSVENFKALSSVTQLLAQKTCKALSNDGTERPHHLSQCAELSSNVVFLYDYVNSALESKAVVQELISGFVHDLTAALAVRVKVGIVTQPCYGGVSGLQSIGQFREFVANIRTSYSVEYPELVKQLRTETFTGVPVTEQRVAVMIIDDAVQNLHLIQEEVMRLKFSNVKVIVVAVGKVEEAVLEQMATAPIRDHVLRVDSYGQMRDTKLDILAALCGKSEDVFGGDETSTPSIDVRTQGSSDNDVFIFDFTPN